jgi:hypothetical protein
VAKLWRGRLLALAIAAMETLARLRAGDRKIEFGVATTEAECMAVLAQRFRVYQRWGYYGAGLRVERDVHDESSVCLLPRLKGEPSDGLLAGSARVVLGRERGGFQFPAQDAFAFARPDGVRDLPVSQCHEVGRLVSERPEGVVPGALLTPLGLMQAASLYSWRVAIRCGLGVIKQRLVRALQGIGVRMHEILSARLISPKNGPISGYFYRHPDPPIPVYWVENIVLSIEQAIENYQVLVESSIPA